MTFTATESGTHYIAAGAAGVFSGRGTYEVEVTDTSPPIVAPDPDPEDPPVAQEQEQQQEQDEPPAVTVVPSEPETAQAQDEAASVSEGGTDLPTDVTTTGRVVVGGSATGNIEYNGTVEYNADTDWFAVTLEAGKLYRFGQEGSGTGAGTLRDTFLRGIYDANGELIDGTTNDNGGVSYDTRVFFSPEEDATYYVSAGGYSNRTGTYTLRVTEIPDDYAADLATTGTVVVDGSATGHVEYRGDTDWFAVTLETGKAYRFDLKGSPTGGGNLYDPYLRGIYDANGDRIDGTTDDDGGVGLNSRLTFTPDEGATYYVSAGAYGNHVGTYTLAVEEVDAM